MFPNHGSAGQAAIETQGSTAYRPTHDVPLLIQQLTPPVPRCDEGGVFAETAM